MIESFKGSGPGLLARPPGTARDGGFGVVSGPLKLHPMDSNAVSFSRLPAWSVFATTPSRHGAAVHYAACPAGPAG